MKVIEKYLDTKNKKIAIIKNRKGGIKCILLPYLNYNLKIISKGTRRNDTSLPQSCHKV